MKEVFTILDKIAKKQELREQLIDLVSKTLAKNEYNPALNYSSYEGEIEILDTLIARMDKESERVQRVHRDAPRTRGGSRY
jgi:hypothetical protein